MEQKREAKGRTSKRKEWRFGQSTSKSERISMKMQQKRKREISCRLSENLYKGDEKLKIDI